MISSKKTSITTLHNWLIELHSKPSIIERFEYVELDELNDYLDKRILDSLDFINNFLMLNQYYSFEHCSNNFSQLGMTYSGLKNIKEIITNRMVQLQGVNIFNKTIFLDLPSELFFKKITKEWLSKTNNKKTAISYVFRIMWDNTEPTEKPENMKHEIVCTQSRFAKFWNKNYSEIFEIENPKQPKFKTLLEITSNSYELKLTSFLNN